MKRTGSKIMMIAQGRRSLWAGVLCLAGLTMAACGANNAAGTLNQANRVAADANTAVVTPNPVDATAARAGTSTPATHAQVSATASDDQNTIAQRIAGEFAVPVSEITGYHAQGIGYGVLAQLYALAQGRCGGQSKYTVQQLVDLHKHGTGMGEIRRRVRGTSSARGCNLGQLKQQELDDADKNDQGNGKGNGKGQGKGKAKDKEK